MGSNVRSGSQPSRNAVEIGDMGFDSPHSLLCVVWVCPFPDACPRDRADGSTSATLTPSISGWVPIVGGLLMGIASVLIVVGSTCASSSGSCMLILIAQLVVFNYIMGEFIRFTATLTP